MHGQFKSWHDWTAKVSIHNLGGEFLKGGFLFPGKNVRLGFSAK